MTKKIISDAITNISIEFIEKVANYTVAKKVRKSVWIKGGGNGCLSLHDRYGGDFCCTARRLCNGY